MTPDTNFDYIRKLLKQKSGLTLSAEKQYLVESRLFPVAQRRGFADLCELVRHLRAGDESLTTSVVEAMTTNETYFFRDRLPFEHFSSFVLPSLVAARAKQKRIRIWCAAAASGQEPYSLAIAIRELGRLVEGFRIDIVATDLSTPVLEKARSGVYNQFEVQRGLPVQLLLKYFSQIGETWQVAADIRAMVQFKTFNLLADFARLGPFDLVFCRNVLIYFDHETKSGILDRLAGVTAGDGFLVMGSTETTIGLTRNFVPVSERRGLYAPAPVATAAAIVRPLPAAGTPIAAAI